MTATLPILLIILFLYLVGLLAGIVITLLYEIALVRMSRTGFLREAFCFREILATIRRIGWLEYGVALLIGLVLVGLAGCVLGIITGVLMVVFFLIPLVGILLMMVWLIISIFLAAALGIFFARYMALVYAEGEEPSSDDCIQL